MNCEYKIEKLRHWCGIAKKVLLAAEALLVAVCVAGAGLLTWAVFNDPTNLSTRLSVAGNAIAGSGLVTIALLVAILVPLKAGMILAAMENVRRITADIADGGSPFAEIHVKRMKRVAILIAVGSVIHTFSSTLFELMVALVVWMLAMVFEYGCVLQQESDETL